MDYSSPGRNYINHPGMPDDILMTINMGGAMGDGAWLEQGDVPMLSIHSKFDFFAPYDTGMVYVPIGAQFFAVVSVTGSYGAIKAANAFGNNDVFLDENYTDAVWVDQQATNPTGEECLYTVEIPPAQAATPWIVHTSPWNWYDPNDPNITSTDANPNVKSTSIAWMDTVMSFIVPRIATVLQAEGVPAGIVETAQSFKVYPNPASDLVAIKGTNGSMFTSVQAFDITGRVVYASDATGNSLSIDVSNWNNGIYLVQIATENGVQVKRIIVN